MGFDPGTGGPSPTAPSFVAETIKIMINIDQRSTKVTLIEVLMEVIGDLLKSGSCASIGRSGSGYFL